jgi:hypothetical protein
MQSARHDERLLPAGILTSYPHHDDAVRRVPTSPAGNPEAGFGVGGLPGPFSKSARRGAPTSVHCQRFPTQGILATDDGHPPMKFCYCDESGTGEEPIAVMVGILVDSHRMHITKHEWTDLLQALSKRAGRQIEELHTRNFYAGNGIWKELDGPTRAAIISLIFEWLAERKHNIVYTSVCKASYYEQFNLQRVPDELNTLWRFMGFHLLLAIQKYCQTYPKNKGNTVLIFDNEEREQMRFTDVIMRPPNWSGEYYGKKPKSDPLDQIVDVPYFGDSKEVALIQLADFLAFFLRRYAEIKENLVPAKYQDEEQKINGWIKSMIERSIGRSMIYPKVGRNSAEELFFRNASASIRELG